MPLSAETELRTPVPGTHSKLRTGAWHGDLPLELAFPPEWNITIHWPKTPPPLTDDLLIPQLESPIGQPPIRELCRGKSRPLVIIDDVNRPTPAAPFLRYLLREFQAAGILSSNVTVLVARGSHGGPQPESLLQKVGPEISSACRVLVHDPYRHTVKIGRTSFGTPVYVNREVPAADFVMGIGGVYPNNTAGFGGGAKLALGVLDVRVISLLHRKHKGMGWGAVGPANNFRKDIEEIARTIGLHTLITAHVNADRHLVRVRCGDFQKYYAEEVAFARDAFRAPKPHGADVVISNAFPNDLSLTFIHMKGLYPLRHAPVGASRVVLGSCAEGEGFHGVYPIVRMPFLHEHRDRLRRISLLSPGEIAGKITRKIAAKLLRRESYSSAPPSAAPATVQNTRPRNPIWFFRTGSYSDPLPPVVRGMRAAGSWGSLLETIHAEQGGRRNLNVTIYPCAPLQVLE